MSPYTYLGPTRLLLSFEAVANVEGPAPGPSLRKVSPSRCSPLPRTLHTTATRSSRTRLARMFVAEKNYSAVRASISRLAPRMEIGFWIGSGRSSFVGDNMRMLHSRSKQSLESLCSRTFTLCRSRDSSSAPRRPYVVRSGLPRGPEHAGGYLLKAPRTPDHFSSLDSSVVTVGNLGLDLVAVKDMEERFPSSHILTRMFTTEIDVRQIVHDQFSNCNIIAMTSRLDLGADIDHFVVLGGGRSLESRGLRPLLLLAAGSRAP